MDKVFKTTEYTETLKSTRDSLFDKGRDYVTVPSWGIKDFMNERARWQKGIDVGSIDPSYCYFRLFFNFQSEYGLIGGILNDTPTQQGTTSSLVNSNRSYDKGQNTAYQYLTNLINGGRTNVQELIDRRNMLVRFTNTLNYISNNAPWFFNEISGLQEGINLDFESLTKEKTLDINCIPDAIDMRLTTLIDMYKFICYDNVNCKEVIPENLRKFDIQLVVFNMPIRYYQTGIISKFGQSVGYKSLDDPDYTNRMSFKMVTFKNCEFDITSMNSIIDTVNNSDPFQLQYQLKVKYSKAYETNLNEMMQLFFGPNEIYWDENLYLEGNSHNQGNPTDAKSKRMKALETSLYNIYYYNPNSNPPKALIDASEALVDNIIKIF